MTRLTVAVRGDAHLATAAAMYREMGMHYWLGEAEAAMANGGRWA